MAGTNAQGWADVDRDKSQTTFYYPNALATDSQGNVYVAEQNRIMRICANGRVERFAGHDLAGDMDAPEPASARFRGIGGLAVDAQDNVYVADSHNHKIKTVTAAGIVTTFAGNGRTDATTYGVQATQTALNRPIGVLPLPDGSVLIADSGNNAVHRVSVDGIVRPFAGKIEFTWYQGGGTYSGDAGLAVDAGLNTPTRLARSHDGRIFIADSFNHRIRQVTPDGRIWTLAGSVQGYAPGGKLLNFPHALLAHGGSLYVGDTGNRVVLKYRLD